MHFDPGGKGGRVGNAGTVEPQRLQVQTALLHVGVVALDAILLHERPEVGVRRRAGGRGGGSDGDDDQEVWTAQVSPLLRADGCGRVRTYGHAKGSMRRA